MQHGAVPSKRHVAALLHDAAPHPEAPPGAPASSAGPVVMEEASSGSSASSVFAPASSSAGGSVTSASEPTTSASAPEDDPSSGEQTGTLYGKWVVLGVIAFQASLQGTLDCSTGELSAIWVNGVWGLPGPAPADASAPLSVIATGMAPGDLTAAVVSGSPGTIAGTLDWFESSTDNGSECHGTYTATLQQ